MQQNLILNYHLLYDNFNMIFGKMLTQFHSFQQLVFRRIKRLAESHEAAVENVNEQEKKALQKLEQITRTCCGIIQYIDLLRFMQKIPDQ